MLGMANRPRWLRWLLWGAGLAICLGACIAFGWWWQAASLVAENLVRPRNANLDPAAPHPDVDLTFRVARDRSVELDVWVLHPRADHPANAVDTMLVFHGISDRKSTMVGLARRFSLAGVRSVLMDFRGHGDSSTTEVTFGVKEQEDASAVLDELEQRGFPVGKVGIYGPSFGGAVAIQLAGSDPRIARAVTVASFASMRRIVGPYLSDTWGGVGAWVPGFVIEGLLDRAGEAAGFDPANASPQRAIARGQARILLVHSNADEIVPYQHARDMVEACGARCRLLTLEGLTHLQSMSNVPLRYQSFRHLIGEDFPGDVELERRFRERASEAASEPGTPPSRGSD